MSTTTTHLLQLVGIAKTWALKTLPGWCDDIHRDLLTRHGAVATDGRASASSLDARQLAAVLDDYERRGWPRKKQVFTGQGKAKPVPEGIAHLVRLWGRLGQAGKVKDATRPALLAFCARQTRHEVADLDSLSVEERQAITEAIKGWLVR